MLVLLLVFCGKTQKHGLTNAFSHVFSVCTEDFRLSSIKTPALFLISDTYFSSVRLEVPKVRQQQRTVTLKECQTQDFKGKYMIQYVHLQDADAEPLQKICANVKSAKHLLF